MTTDTLWRDALASETATVGQTGDPTHMMPHHVFLSHNHGDKEFVRRLATDLRDSGVTVWLDEWQLHVGDSLVERIQTGILEAGYLAVVLSPRSVGSDWVKRELNAALAEETRRRGVFILPILLEDCDLPLFVRDKMYADFRQRYTDGLQAIMKVVLPGDSWKGNRLRSRWSSRSWDGHCWGSEKPEVPTPYPILRSEFVPNRSPMAHGSDRF